MQHQVTWCAETAAIDINQAVQSFPAIDAQLLYAAPSHSICITKGEGPYLVDGEGGAGVLDKDVRETAAMISIKPYLVDGQ
jgi:hypothetical protein